MRPEGRASLFFTSPHFGAKCTSSSSAWNLLKHEVSLNLTASSVVRFLSCVALILLGMAGLFRRLVRFA